MVDVDGDGYAGGAEGPDWQDEDAQVFPGAEEDLSAIDPVATQRIEDLIAGLRRDYTIIIVTHNLSQARRVSEHAVFMFAGRIIEAGLTERLFAEPRTELTRNFISGRIG